MPKDRREIWSQVISTAGAYDDEARRAGFFGYLRLYWYWQSNSGNAIQLTMWWSGDLQAANSNYCKYESNNILVISCYKLALW